MASAFSVRSQNKTDLVPNSLVGNNDSKFISMTPNLGINFYDSVSTILASISWNGISTNNPNGFDIQSPLNMNNKNINNVNSLNGPTGGIDLTLNSSGNITLDASGNITLDSSGNIQLDASGGVVNILSSNLNMNDNDIDGVNFINGTSDLTLSASDIYTNCQGLQFDAGSYINLDCNNGDINLTAPNGKTYINLSGVSTGDGELVCSTYSSVGDLSISALSAGVVSLNSGDNTQITCGENFFVQTNSTTGIVKFNTGDLFNGGGIIWNNLPMGITFFNKWQKSFTYSNIASWEMVKQNSISFPTTFLYGTWAVSFSINCSNVGSAPLDKELAMFFNFKDGNGITYDGFSYNLQTPFAQYFNASNYTNTSQTPLSITYTDYFDFSGATNNLELQINWYGFSSYNQDFNVSTTFTLMRLI